MPWARGLRTCGSVEPLAEMHRISQLRSHRMYWRLKRKLRETILTLLHTVHSYLSSQMGLFGLNAGRNSFNRLLAHQWVTNHGLEATHLGLSRHSACVTQPWDGGGDHTALESEGLWVQIPALHAPVYLLA